MDFLKTAGELSFASLAYYARVGTIDARSVTILERELIYACSIRLPFLEEEAGLEAYIPNQGRGDSPGNSGPARSRHTIELQDRTGCGIESPYRYLL